MPDIVIFLHTVAEVKAARHFEIRWIPDFNQKNGIHKFKLKGPCGCMISFWIWLTDVSKYLKSADQSVSAITLSLCEKLKGRKEE